jgi:hypothetical protein
MNMTGGTLTAAYEQIGVLGAAILTQQGGSQTVSQDITIASYSSSAAALTVSGGTLQDNGNTYVGGSSASAGGVGSLFVSGGSMTVNGTLMIYDPNGTVYLSSGSLTVGTLDDNSNPSRLNWTGGVLQITQEALEFAVNDAPYNTNPFGGSLTLGNGQTLQVDASEWLVGGGSSVTQNTGSINNVADLDVAGSGSAATYTLNDGTLTGGYALIGYIAPNGRGGAGIVNQSGGTDSLTSIYVGYNTTGTYNLSGGTLSPSTIYLNAGGTLHQTGGTLSFTTFNQSGGAANIDTGLTLASATYNLSGGTLTTNRSYGDFIGFINIATSVGGPGNFNQTGGTYTTPSIYIGEDAPGTYDLTSSGILNVTGTTYVGYLSSGTFNADGAVTTWALSVHTGILTISGGTFASGSTYNAGGTITQTGGSSNLGPVTGTGTINVGTTPSQGGTLSVPMIVTALQQNFVNIQTRGLLELTGGTNNTVSTLSINGGDLDLTNTHLIMSYAGAKDPSVTILGYLKSGYNGGAWNGLGIESTTAQTHPGYGVGFADSADHVDTSLGGQEIEVAYALYGDVNLDGSVNGTDFSVLAAHFGENVTGGWEMGDFNYDGVVNGTDFSLLAGNFGKSASGAEIALPASEWSALYAFANAHGLQADVPEPGTAGLLTLFTLGTLLRRRRASNSKRVDCNVCCHSELNVVP